MIGSHESHDLDIEDTFEKFANDCIKHNGAPVLGNAQITLF